MNDSTDRDAFDTLLDYAPEKFNKLKTTLMVFVNQHLDKLGLSGRVSNNEMDFWEKKSYKFLSKISISDQNLIFEKFFDI